MTQDDADADADAIRDQVAQRYGQIAEAEKANGCGPSCCSGSTSQHAELIGYDQQQLQVLPEGANLGLGCGNPTTITLIEPGMTVVDLGSGAGIDCFLAAQKVGPTGKVIGVDMTDAMLEKARAFAAEKGYTNVEFRKGLIEALPVEDASVDLIISNCVINLSPDKPKVFQEIARVLKPGGRAAVSDIVLLQPLPDSIRSNVEAYIACIGGAVSVDTYLADVRAAGLTIAKAERKSYDVTAVLACSPDMSDVVDKLPKDFDAAASIASLDLLAVR